jgi:hypothetical protein
MIYWRFCIKSFNVAKVYKPDFIYIISDLLKQEVAVSKKTGWVYCEDGVKYSPQEMAVIKKAGSVLDAETHMVKKTIGGEITEVINDRRAAENKPVEGGQRAGSVENNGTGEKVPGVNGVSAENGDGELEIY